MTSMMFAVAHADLRRDEFLSRKVPPVPSAKVKWPRKRFNGTVGIVREVNTGTFVKKVN